VETAGNRNLQTNTYKQDYNYKDRLESVNQVVGPISAQALVGWKPVSSARDLQLKDASQ
jgi:hypothetical protein